MIDPLDIITTDSDVLRANQAYPGFGYTIIPGEAMNELILYCDKTGHRTLVSVPKGHSVIFTLPPKDYTESRLVARGVNAPVNPLKSLREEPAEERITAEEFRDFAIVRYHLRRFWHIWIDRRVLPRTKGIEFVVCVTELDKTASAIDFADVGFPKLVHALKYVNGVKPKTWGDK